MACCLRLFLGVTVNHRVYNQWVGDVQVASFDRVAPCLGILCTRGAVDVAIAIEVDAAYRVTCHATGAATGLGETEPRKLRVGAMVDDQRLIVPCGDDAAFKPFSEFAGKPSGFRDFVQSHTII